jgi:hypothetical protein
MTIERKHTMSRVKKNARLKNPEYVSDYEEMRAVVSNVEMSYEQWLKNPDALGTNLIQYAHNALNDLDKHFEGVRGLKAAKKDIELVIKQINKEMDKRKRPKPQAEAMPSESRALVVVAPAAPAIIPANTVSVIYSATKTDRGIVIKVVYADIVERREKAIKVQTDDGLSIWLPLSGIKQIPNRGNLYSLEDWFKKAMSRYQALWFLNHVEDKTASAI